MAFTDSHIRTLGPLACHRLCGAISIFVLFCLAAEAQAEERRVYTNAADGYVVSYPTNWFASSAVYRNTIEIRNYDESHRVTGKDEARFLISCEQIVSAEQAARRVNDLIEATSKSAGFQVDMIPIGGNTLYQWTALQPAAVPARDKLNHAMRMRIRVASAIIGTQIVRIDGTAWEDADSQVIAEMKEIARSLRLLSRKGEAK